MKFNLFRKNPLRLMQSRIFWKVFAAFWLANLLIMLATTYVLLHRVESERLRQDYQKGVTNLVERLVDRGQNRPLSQRRLNGMLRRFFRTTDYVLEVYENNQRVLSIQRGQHSPKPTYILDVVLADGRELEVRTLPPRLPRMLLELVRKVHTLHLLFMVLISTLISLLLSWSLVRPLQQLGRSSRQFAIGASDGLSGTILRRADEIGQLARDINYMMSTVKQTMLTQKQMLYDVSHELRAPLARLQVAAELIQRDSPKDARHIQRVHQECERMDQLIQRILNFSRLEQNSEWQRVDLRDVVRAEVESVHYENPQRDIQLTLPDTPIERSIRPGLFGQALENILRNACKHTPAESPVEVSLARMDDRILISVRDHGPGVSQSEIDRLKEPFFRAGNRMHGEGFGLGLSIAHRSVEAHGARLTFENHPNGGLVVTIDLSHN